MRPRDARRFHFKLGYGGLADVQFAVELSLMRHGAGNLADRFVEHMDSYFRFITTPNVEPTNNLAEQAIRFVAIHRRVTQGTRGDAGQRWCERIWTVVATCAQQGRSVFDFLCQAVESHFHQTPAPSLLVNPSEV